MANSAISICNVALSVMGQRSIRTFEDNVNAKLCENVYNFALTFIMYRLDWAFARGYKKLNKVLEHGIPIGAREAIYQLPSDCLRPLELSPKGNFDSWEVIGDKIRARDFGDTDEDRPILRYTKKETNPGLFSETFSSLLVDFLVAKLSGPIAGISMKETTQLYNQFLSNLEMMTAIDANIGSEERLPDDTPGLDSFNREL